MQIIFINYGEYSSASGVHIHFLANALQALGHECTVCLPWGGKKDYFGTPLYTIYDFREMLNVLCTGKYGPDTIVHAWTPRETVRLFTLIVAKTLNVPWFVHLEDNERRLLESQYGQSFEALCILARKRLFAFGNFLSHPLLHQTFLAEAAGVSCIIDRLEEFVPPDVPRVTIWPACESDFFSLPLERSPRLRHMYGVPEGATVLVYPGNVHFANADVMSALYMALPLLESHGYPVHLIRCGEDMRINDTTEAIRARYVTQIPQPDAVSLIALLRAADVLVQPGKPGNFDDYRFPSKLPMFLASGRPVVLAATNIGAYLTNEVNCLHLQENSPECIAEHVARLIANPAMAQRIGAQGRAFARDHFSWDVSAQKMEAFYQSSLRAHRQTAGQQYPPPVLPVQEG